RYGPFCLSKCATSFYNAREQTVSSVQKVLENNLLFHTTLCKEKTGDIFCCAHVRGLILPGQHGIFKMEDLTSGTKPPPKKPDPAAVPPPK
ncbi:MAG: hypothetical protein ACI4JC_05610, partial [Faecalibacterium sp.]